MNILFLLKSFEIGGLEVVTTTLANKFRREGHKVVLWAFYEEKPSLIDRLDAGIHLIYGHGFIPSKQNVMCLRKTIVDNNIDIVINQWGLPFIPAYTLKRASKGLDVKIIAVYHNDPSTNGRLKDVELDIEKTFNPIKQLLLHFKYWIYKLITSASMRYVYNNSDKYLVLSDSFVDGFEKFTGIKDAKKLAVLTNPITIDISNFELDLSKKEKEIIFVGRLDYNQKRVHRVIEIWALLEAYYPEWRLTIVGDGVERANLEKMTRNLNLKNVKFEGYQRPESYYKRASLLLLTSEFEGFGLVIVECMCFGVIPAVYGSYSAVYDMISDNINGIIIPKRENFEPEDFAKRISAVMNGSDDFSSMAVSAIDTSRNYSIDTIYEKWMIVFKELK